MAARNMYRIEINTHEKEFASSWLFKKRRGISTDHRNNEG
jgi:hypothetical protein